MNTVYRPSDKVYTAVSVSFNIYSTSYNAVHTISQTLTREKQFKTAVSYFEIVDLVKSEYRHVNTHVRPGCQWIVKHFGHKGTHKVTLYTHPSDVAGVLQGLQKHARHMMHIHNHDSDLPLQVNYLQGVILPVPKV